MAISRDRYSTVAISLHWVIALAILTNIGIAWYFNTLHGAVKIEPVQLHKSIGITVLVLSTLRLGWRLAVPAPKLPAYVTGWEKWLAQAVHLPGGRASPAMLHGSVNRRACLARILCSP